MNKITVTVRKDGRKQDTCNCNAYKFPHRRVDACDKVEEEEEREAAEWREELNAMCHHSYWH